jgi:hypothetical protein
VLPTMGVHVQYVCSEIQAQTLQSNHFRYYIHVFHGSFNSVECREIPEDQLLNAVRAL